MSRNRYVGDYSLIDEIDERGQLRTRTKYIGSHYRFSQGFESIRTRRRWIAGACLAAWIAFVLCLVPVSGAGHALYVILPFAVSALPLALETEIILELLRAKEILEHRMADRLENRYPACAFFHVLLAGISVLAQGIRGIAGGEWLAGDTVFLVLGTANVVLGVWLFHSRKALRCEKLEK